MLKRLLNALRSLFRRFRSSCNAQEPLPAPLVPIQPRAPIVPSDQPRTERLQSLDQALDNALSFALRPGEQGPPEKRAKLRGKWKKDIPDLARACARWIDGDLDLFPGLPLSPEELVALVDEVRLLENMIHLVRRFLRQLENILAARKEELCDSTHVIVDTIQGMSRTPLLSPEQKRRINLIAKPVLCHIEERNGKVRQVRRHNRHVQQQAEAKVAEKREELARTEAENHVLRGGSLKDVVRRDKD